MDVEVNIMKNLVRPKVVIHTKEITPEITELVRRLTEYNGQSLVGYKGEEIIILQLEDIYRIYAQGQKVIVQTDKDTAQLKFRLYELEEKLTGTSLVRISNSEIINFKKVKSLDFSINGTISIKLDTGDKSFVSRRYVDKIKKYIGIS